MKALDGVESKMRPIPWLSWDDKYRFYLKVDKRSDSECWNWTGCKVDGYGMFAIQSQPFLSNRVAYFIAYQEPGQIRVCHECNNRACCNPGHLYLGSQSENIKQMFADRRCTHASELNPRATLSDANVIEIRRLHESGTKPTELADKFHVSKNTVHKIVYHKTHLGVVHAH